MHVWPFDDRKKSSILGTIHLRRRHFLGGWGGGESGHKLADWRGLGFKNCENLPTTSVDGPY